MLRRVTSVAKLGLVMGVATLLAACTPANTTNTGFLAYEPNPGYEWADADGWSWAVVWKPGKAHPTQPRVFASQTPGDWVPALGYAWVSQDSSDLRVAWKQGLTYASLPHVTTDSKEGTWTADPGYAFKRPDSLEVFWQAGRGHPQKPHFVAAAQEGSWDVEAGYRKVTNVVGGEWAEWS